MLGISSASAEQVAFLCVWKAGIVGQAGSTLYVDYPLMFEVDLSRREFRVFDDLDKKVLGLPTILATERAFKLEFQNLAITGVESRAKIVVCIYRFYLTSTMILETWLSNVAIPGFSQTWSRSGTCRKRQV